MRKQNLFGALGMGLALMAGGCVGGGVQGETETVRQNQDHADDPHGATVLVSGQEADGRLRRGGRAVLYAVDVNAGDYLIAETDLGSLRDTTLTLSDSDGTTLAYNDDFGRSYASQIEHEVTSDGRLYLQVGAFNRRQSGTFKLNVDITPAPEPEPRPAQCRRGGCSGQVCADHNFISTCEFRPEYACYRAAACARQADGECGWTMDEDLLSCLRDHGVGGDPDPQPVDDHGNDLASATSIENNGRVTGILEEGGDQDWFVFAAGPFGGVFTITTDLGTLSDTRLLATDDSGRQLAENDDFHGTYASQVQVLAHPFQRIGLRVTGYSRQLHGSYTLTVDAPDAPVDPEPEPRDDHANGPDGATVIEAGQAVQGIIEEGGDQDWFTFDAGAGVEFKIKTILGTLVDTTLAVFDASGHLLADNDDYDGTYASQVTVVTDGEGRLLVKVAAYSRRQTGSYTLEVAGPPVRPVPMCHRDAGEAECAAYGGRFGRFGLLGQVQCICPTSDSGNSCTSGDQCSGACLCEGFGGDAREGECSPWVVDFGCYCTMLNGRGAMLCVD